MLTCCNCVLQYCHTFQANFRYIAKSCCGEKEAMNFEASLRTSLCVTSAYSDSCVHLQDTLILSSIVVICTLLILIYWWNK